VRPTIVIDTQDPDFANEFVRSRHQWAKSYSIIGPRRDFRLRCVSLNLRSALISRSITSANRIEGTPVDRVVSIVSEQGSCSIESRGHSVSSSNGSSAIVQPRDRYVYQSSDKDAGFVISMELNDIARHIDIQDGDRLSIANATMPLSLDLTCGKGASFYRALAFIWDQLTNPGSPEPPPALLAAYEDLLLHDYVAMLLPALDGRTEQRAVDPGADLVRRACDLIRFRVDQPIRIGDIAGELGISARRLQAGFRRHLDTTPGQFLRDRRLELAHRLLSAPQAGSTVTSIALDCGFNHLGEFSGLYRRRYGISPSKTIRSA
jgi:AraC-like DNA-binding protein